MGVTVRETTPDALPTAVDAEELTLVLGAPGVGKSHAVSELDWPVRRLTAIEDDDGPVVVDDFITELRSNHHERTEAVHALGDRPAGAVMVTRPRSLDWYFQTYEDDTRFGTLLDQFDTVLVVRIPPGAATETVRTMLDESQEGAGHGHRVSTDLSEAHDIRPLAISPTYEYQSSYLARHLGWYDRTVLPGELTALTAREPESVVVGSALTEARAEHTTDLGPFVEAAIRPTDIPPFDETPGVTVEDMFPDGATPRSLPPFDDPALEAAVAIVTSHAVAGETDWLDTLTEVSVLPAAEEAIEATLSLPPGTMNWVTAFASEHVRAKFRERIDDDSDEFGAIDRGSDEETSEELLAAVESHADQLERMHAVFETLESVAVPATEHGDAFVPEYRQQTHTLEEFYPPEQDPVDASEQADDLDAALDALDDNLVIVTGSRGGGVYAVTRRVGERLTDWGVEVRIPPTSRLGNTLENRSDVLDGPVCLFRISGFEGVSPSPGKLATADTIERVLDLLEAGHTSGVVIGCPERHLDQLRDRVESADAADHPAWCDREMVSVSGGSGGGATSDEPAGPDEVAETLLSEMGFGEGHQPSYLEIERIDGRSDIAVLSGVTDSKLDPRYLGEVLAETAMELSTIYEPRRGAQWLIVADEYLRAAVTRRGEHGDEREAAYRTMYAQAMVLLAQDDPQNHGWLRLVRNLIAEADWKNFADDTFYLLLETYGDALGHLLTAEDGRPDAGGAQSVNDLLRADLGRMGNEVGSMEETYCRAVARVFEDSTDPAAGEPALRFLDQLLEDAMHHVEESNEGHNFGRMVLGHLVALPVEESIPEDSLQGWVERIDDMAVDLMLQLSEPYPPRYLVADYYAWALSRWALGDGVDFETIEPWLGHVETCMGQTMQRDEVEVPPSVFSRRSYSSTLLNTYERVPRDGVEEDLAGFSAWFRRLAEAPYHDGSPGRLLATAQARGLESLGFSESIDGEQIERWFELYDAQIQADATADWHDIDGAAYYRTVYNGALSRQQMGRPWDRDLMPRSETVWFGNLTDRVRVVALEQAHPGAFLLDVYGDAADAWIRSNEADETTLEWVDMLTEECCRVGRDLERPEKEEWFRESADIFGRLFAAIAASTRDDMTRRKLTSTVWSVIRDVATDPENPLSAGAYVTQAFAAAFARTVGTQPSGQSFQLGELLAMFRRIDVASVIDSDEQVTLAAVVGNAIASVALASRPAPYAESWFRAMAAALRDLPAGIVEQEERFVTAVYGLLESRLDGEPSVSLEPTIEELRSSTIAALAGQTGDPESIRASVESVAERLARAESDEMDRWEPASLAAVMVRD